MEAAARLKGSDLGRLDGVVQRLQEDKLARWNHDNSARAQEPWRQGAVAHGRQASLHDQIDVLYLLCLFYIGILDARLRGNEDCLHTKDRFEFLKGPQSEVETPVHLHGVEAGLCYHIDILDFCLYHHPINTLDVYPRHVDILQHLPRGCLGTPSRKGPL